MERIKESTSHIISTRRGLQRCIQLFQKRNMVNRCYNGCVSDAALLSNSNKNQQKSNLVKPWLGRYFLQLFSCHYCVIHFFTDCFISSCYKHALHHNLPIRNMHCDITLILAYFYEIAFSEETVDLTHLLYMEHLQEITYCG